MSQGFPEFPVSHKSSDLVPALSALSFTTGGHPLLELDALVFFFFFLNTPIVLQPREHTQTHTYGLYTHTHAEQLGMLKAVSFGTTEQRKEKRVEARGGNVGGCICEPRKNKDISTETRLQQLVYTDIEKQQTG